MSQVHIYCSLNEMILLCRLDLKSHLSDWILTMRAEIELNLRDSEAAMLKLEAASEDPGSWICRDSAGSLFNLGVLNFSGLDFGGDVTVSQIGRNLKKDFPTITWRAGGESLGWLELDWI